MKDTELDQRLKAWAVRQDATADTPTLEARIVAALAKKTPVVQRRRWTHVASFLAGAAAAVVIALLTLLATRAPRAEREFAGLLEEEGRLSEQRRASMAKIFNETERLFGSNLQWVAEGGTTVEMGLSETPADGEPMALRVTVVRRDAGGEWRRVWGMEVVARHDGTLEMEEPRMSLSLRRLDGQLAFVESSLVVRNGFSLDAQSRETLHFGEAKSVRHIIDDNYEYHVLYTVIPTGEG